MVAGATMQELAMFALDLQGHGGVVEGPDSPMDARFQAMLMRSPATRIEGGSDEILRNIIAERVLGLPGDIRVDKTVAFKDIPHQRPPQDLGDARTVGAAHARGDHQLGPGAAVDDDVGAGDEPRLRPRQEGDGRGGILRLAHPAERISPHRGGVGSRRRAWAAAQAGPGRPRGRRCWRGFRRGPSHRPAGGPA
ncbi:hypothetical protein LRS04_15560 [Phenylobacterium sp. J367]|nr:acyl-CoA dehydrogenase family protein [Phenylobacterium sp. J367]MCR5879590.1 hypothetical protein [Phenylobacterium sp. J367]